MTYATTQDLIDRYGEAELVALTDRAGEDEIDADVVARALADAEAEINSYLSARYVVPLSTVPQIVVARVCEVARYYLHEEHATETVKARYDAAVRWVRDVAAGKASLGDDDVAPTEPASGAGPQFEAPERVFSRASLKGY